MVSPYSDPTFPHSKGFIENLEKEEPFGLPKLLRHHERPMLWPAIGFLLGTAYPGNIWLCASLLLLLLAILAGTRFLQDRFEIEANGMAISFRTHNLGSPKATSTMFVNNALFKSGVHTLLLLIVAGYLAGTFRGAVWAKKISAAEHLANIEQPSTQVDGVLVEVMGNSKVKSSTVVFTGKIHSFMENYYTKSGTRVLREIPLPAKYKGLFVHVCLYQEQVLPEPGDFVFVKGKLAIPSGAKNPGEFDYRKYLMGKQVFLELKGIIEPDQQNKIRVSERVANQSFWRRPWYRKMVHRISRHIETRIDTLFVEEQKGIVKALFLGDKGDLSPLDSEKFRIAGLYRFIAIAGFHVQLVAMAVERISRRIFKNVHVSMVAGICSAFLLSSLSGWAIGPLRAFLCVLLRHFAFWSRRKYDILAGFAICSFIIGWRIPYPLLNVSFQLSFAGMLAGWISNEYTQFLVRKFDLGIVRQSLLQSLLMAVFLLPVLATHFQDVSVAGFFLGGLWAVVAVAVILSSLPLFCLFLRLSRVLGWFPFFVLNGMRWIGYTVARVPVASFVFPAPNFAEIFAYFGLVFLLLHARTATREATSTTMSTHTRRLLILIMSLILFVSGLFRYYLPWPQVVFLSVGQGDCAVIRSKSAVVVVDTGTGSSAKRVLAPYLKTQGIKQIDLCIISHLHEDHVGGLGELCNNFKVKTIMTCPGSTQTIRTIISDTKQANSTSLQIIEAGAGDIYQIATILMSVIHPQKHVGRIGEDSKTIAKNLTKDTAATIDTGKTTATSTQTSGGEAAPGFNNEDSLVISLEFNKFPAHVELWGDAPGKVVLDLMDERNKSHSPGVKKSSEVALWKDCTLGTHKALESGAFGDAHKNAVTIVKVPHHGSPDSLVYGFYERLPGGMAVISVGPNSYGHPSSDVIRAAEQGGLAVYRTDIDGAVTVRVYKTGVRVRTFIKRIFFCNR